MNDLGAQQELTGKPGRLESNIGAWQQCSISGVRARNTQHTRPGAMPIAVLCCRGSSHALKTCRNSVPHSVPRMLER
jgi:hypothetical protein